MTPEILFFKSNLQNFIHEVPINLEWEALNYYKVEILNKDKPNFKVDVTFNKYPILTSVQYSNNLVLKVYGVKKTTSFSLNSQAQTFIFKDKIKIPKPFFKIKFSAEIKQTLPLIKFNLRFKILRKLQFVTISKIDKFFFKIKDSKIKIKPNLYINKDLPDVLNKISLKAPNMITPKIYKQIDEFTHYQYSNYRNDFLNAWKIQETHRKSLKKQKYPYFKDSEFYKKPFT
ncbi:MAG: hypothetical protein QM539_04530 [Alphaproteobacteria bacterium]|nr:hypothetical protein [Alphaproteobacteria bacterium]